MARKIPRPFKFPWGGGQIIEEVSCESEYHEPCIQLLEYDGDHEGHVSIRFCSYNQRGGFNRNPLMVGPDEIKKLRKALKDAPQLRKLLKELVKD